MRLNLNKGAKERSAALERFRSILHSKSLRWTEERAAIVKAVLASEGHFDIPELVRSVRAQGVEASRATVYRSLPLLIEAGLPRLKSRT